MSGDPKNFNIDATTKNSLLSFIAQEVAMPASRRMLDFVQSEFATDQTLILAAFTSAIEKPLSIAKDPPHLKSFYELMFSSDSDFDRTFKIHRTTIQWLLKEIKKVCGDFRKDNNVAIKSLCCFVYYLANKHSSFDEIKKVFNVESDEVLVDDFVRVSKALLDIGDRVNLRWPIEAEANQIVERFSRKHRFPDVMGVIGHCIFGSRDRGIVFQGVMDDRGLYYDINATEYRNGKPEMIEYFKATPTYFFMNNYVPGDTSILSRFHLPTTSNCVVCPFVDKGNMIDEEKIFNDMLTKKVNELFYKSVIRQIEHFPRLESLNLPPSQAKWVILGSTVIQNSVNILNDMAF